MKRISRFILGAIIGGFIGSTIVILIAPESGEATRSAVTSRINLLVKNLKTAVDEGREALQKEFDNYKNSSI